MKYDTLLVTVGDAFYTVRINRPHVNNKLSIQCMEEIVRFLDDTADDSENRSIILAGQQDFFCSGGELGDYRAKTVLEIKAFGKAFIDLHTAVMRYPKPIIAAVEGSAFGGGCSLVDACDLAVAAEDAQFGIPEILDGLAPAMGLSGLFASFPKKKIMSMGLLGEKWTAARAESEGLVNFVVPKAQVIEKAEGVARFFGKSSPTALRLFKELYQDMGMGGYENRVRIGQAMMVALFKSDDGIEALSSKTEQRPPLWTGR